MKNKRHSIKDIAAALNVSVTTVSFVLNGKAKEKRISEEVTKKVLEYAKSINQFKECMEVACFIFNGRIFFFRKSK